ncbi:hypothetical protein [Gracilimonas mengyeensis]|nr:hypothetical protein [Gracilimonas mengyeensis]
MQIRKISTAFLLLMMVAGGLISCDLLVLDEDTEYPTRIPALKLGELESLNQEYHALNDSTLCSTLNEFGYTGYSTVLFGEEGNPCDRQNREVVRIEMSELDTLESAAKKALWKNRDFTGVQDTTALELTAIIPLPGCTQNCGGPDENSVNIEWKLTFAEQVVDSAKVIGTEIIVVMDARGVNRIWGNWYPEFNVPEFINYGYQDVQEGMVGWEIDMRSFTGEEKIYTIKEEDVGTEPEMVHLPIISDTDTELRTCWAVSVRYGAQDFAGWYAFIDIEEGFLVKLVPMGEIIP